MSEPETNDNTDRPAPSAPSALYKAGRAAAKAKGFTTSTENTLQGWIAVPNGNYLCAAGGGGIGTPSGEHVTALSTDAKVPGEDGIFTIRYIYVGAATLGITLQTRDGRYVTAVNGGGIGDDPHAQHLRQPITTNATATEIEGTLFVLHDVADKKVTISTVNGFYVTATGGGGIGGSSRVPIHTTAREPGPNEQFTFQLQQLAYSVTTHGPG
jgi:hypothetical protein